MKPLISPDTMRACEARYFVQSGIPSITVMERAAEALARSIREILPKGASIAFACGTGGNGGDGTACARLLHKEYRCTIVQLRAPSTSDAVVNLNRARDCGVSILTQLSELPTVRPHVWVDALFGTGLSRAPAGDDDALIRRITEDHAHGAYVLSADIPSGLNGATGKAYAPCVVADRTVTFQYMKTGLALGDGLDVCGEIIVADVGFPDEFFHPMDAMLLEQMDIARTLSRRPRNIHKGNCGHLLIIAGSFGMTGAAMLCAMAALRSGAGLVTVACPVSIVPMLQTTVPQAMCVPLPEEEGAICRDALAKLREAFIGKDAIVVGCGLSRRTAPEILQAVLECGLPSVIDADALNLISLHPALAKLLRPHHILTPHPGEARRLPAPHNSEGETLPVPFDDAVNAAKVLSLHSATVLYKGAACAIAGESETYVSASGCCGMARGGSGDILSGIMGTLLAEPSDRSPALTAALASEIHGRAGELAQRKYGERGMNSRDIIEFLPQVFME